MKKFNSVLAFGDSHVAGCELSNRYSLKDYSSGNIPIEEADRPGKELAFPKLVSDYLGIKCYNYSMTGGSNERSLRKLIEAVQQHSNSLILFAYTCTDRREFYYPDNGKILGRDENNFIQVGMQWEGKIKSQMQHPINDLYVEKILRPYNNLKDLMFIVDSICTGWATDFRHIPLFPEDMPHVDNLLDFEGETNYLDWCVAKEFKQLPFYHYGLEAHQKLAELILKDLGA